MTEIFIENEQDKLEVSEEIESTIKKVCEEALRYENCDFDAEISITLTDNENIRELNRDHRGIDRPTDVLSFPLLCFDEDGNADEADFDFDGDLLMLGDIVISLERANEQAQELGHSFIREVAFLTAHSMLHLLGYDHEESHEDDELMCKKQDDILNNLGITREN